VKQARRRRRGWWDDGIAKRRALICVLLTNISSLERKLEEMERGHLIGAGRTALTILPLGGSGGGWPAPEKGPDRILCAER
jgi:hypothetical protein